MFAAVISNLVANESETLNSETASNRC